MYKKRVILIIMDGWGKGQKPDADAIFQANTPFVDFYYQKYPHTELITCGKLVGLPEGQMGNSEVGHLNLGAGRIVYQELERINLAIENGTFSKEKGILNAIEYAGEHKKAIHLMGLVSDGGVHSHLNHLKEICNICKEKGVEKVYIHAFTDGRDTDPRSGIQYLKELQSHLKRSTGQIATICGRFYAMDRDNRWERIKVAYDAMTRGLGEKSKDPIQSIQNSYDKNVTDEFLKPIICVDDHDRPIANISNGDAVICFNFRTDRCREITMAFTQKDFPEQDMHRLSLHYTTMTEYDKNFENVHIVFRNTLLNNTLGQVISDQGLRQIRIAETEKYPHVSFFFSGGREKEFDGEKRILIPSPKEVPTYDLKPQMSAYAVTEAILPEIEGCTADFICLNFANADMVGHTGVWDAAVKAVETVDECVGRIVSAALQKDYCIFLTADHGNSDYMINEDGSPNTAHTLNPVPLFIISKDYGGSLKSGKLADVAPSILKYMGINIPGEMTGNILLDDMK